MYEVHCTSIKNDDPEAEATARFDSPPECTCPICGRAYGKGGLVTATDPTTGRKTTIDTCLFTTIDLSEPENGHHARTVFA